MLKKCKVILSVLIALICCQLYIPAAAAENSEPEVTVSTNKTEYADSEEIQGKITVNNTTAYNLEEINLKLNIPEGYTVKDGNAVDGKWNYTIPALTSGAKGEAVFTFVKAKAAAVVPENKTEVKVNDKVTVNDKVEVNVGGKEPKTGDSFPVARVIAAMVCCLGAIIVLVKYGRKKNIVAALLAFAMVMSLLPTRYIMASDNKKDKAEKKTIEYSKDIFIAGNKVTIKFQVNYYVGKKAAPASDLSYEGYNLVWKDEFNESELNRDDWNVELHDPGWVNAELQSYVDSTDNIYLNDGKLVIKPIKTVAENGDVSYTSGRINTQGKHDYTYGLFETRVKVPEGKGYLPAFWLMASDENIYGQWPRCGEIDAMEVHGSDTQKTYGTIHFGKPDRQTQGTYTLTDGSFSDEFHTFAVEWMPGKINWYVDGILYHSADDWYSATEGQGEVSYPAPFDQPFYMILNLAVGGSWVGYPDETTDFANQTYEVDYVRVYQKDSYDENVEKPVKDVVLRDPDLNGNYVINGDFAEDEDLTDNNAWGFLTALGGIGAANITNNEMVITTENAGTADYSIQLVQPNLPMKKNGIYELKFDACADEARTMKVDISGPDNGYVRYFEDTVVNLTSEMQTFTYTFTMENSDDANGRLEFNLGNTASSAKVRIDNVSLKKTDEAEEAPFVKKMLADGNFVYNGKFQEGADRMSYWNINKGTDSQAFVTSLSDNRRLKIVIPEGASETVIVSQKDMAMLNDVEYALSYDIEGPVGATIDVTVNGAASTIDLDGTNKCGNVVKFKSIEDKALSFQFTQPGTYYLDNVRIDEDSLIKNGKFNAGFAGYEKYADGAASASWGVDSLKEDNACEVTISNTGSEDWMIQLKQNNVELIKNQSYRLTLAAKSSIERNIMIAIQRDGSADNNWIPYSGQKTVALNSEYKTITLEFTMTNDTDLKSILSISMGAVGKTQITQKHSVCIDNIKLEKIETPAVNPTPEAQEILQNTDNLAAWSHNDNGNEVSFDGASSTWKITNIGVNSWDVQLSQGNLQLEAGCEYELCFDASTDTTRQIKYDFMDKTSVKWYKGKTININAGKTSNVKFRFTMDTTDPTAQMTISMGKLGDDTPVSANITISNLSLKKVPKTNLLKNGNFANGAEDWEQWYVATTKGASLADGKEIPEFGNNKVTYNINSIGTADWNIQLKQPGITLEQGAEYTLKFKVKSSIARDIKVVCMGTGNAWYVIDNPVVSLNKDEEKTVSIQVGVGDKPTDTAAYVQVAMGAVYGEGQPVPTLDPHTISLYDFELTKN